MILSKIKSRLDGTKSFFDIRSVGTINNKYDIDLNPQGQLTRIIGIDKLIQHVLKYIFVKKGAYISSNIGTSVNIISSKRSADSIRGEILTSLLEYSKYQDTLPKEKSNVIGWDIYRTQTPDIITSWKKVNKYTLGNNFYYDANLRVGNTYYYSVVNVSNIRGKPVSDNVGTGVEITIPNSDTLNAVITDEFAMVPKYKSVTLYWVKDVLIQDEERLRGLTNLLVWVPTGEPRQLSVYLQATNVKKEVATVSATID